MNKLCIYIALYCVLLYTQSALQSCGGASSQPPPVCSIHLDDKGAFTPYCNYRNYEIPIEGSQMLFYVLIEFTSWLEVSGKAKVLWDGFLTIWAWDKLCLLSMRSMTTERLNLYSANDFVLARCGFVRFIALSFDVLSQPKKSPSSNPDYKDTL